MSRCLRVFAVFCLALSVITPGLLAQSTTSIAGTVTDPANAVVANATVTVRNQDTGLTRITQTDSAGTYVVPSLTVGKYRVEVKAPGMQTMEAKDLPVEVGTTVRQDFTLKVASTSEIVEVVATATTVETTAVSIGTVVNQTTVQDIPLNGRHFVDLANLIPGTVVPPVNGFLTAPLRGQGSFAFNSAGAREDSINFMINGINLSDPNQNQITFQPTINTVEEFKVDNQTFSAEYGRNSGSIVNIATRSGVNVWHGEAYEFFRNDDLDARNFSNPTQVTVGGVSQPNLMSPFKRNQFGGDGGGAIRKDKTFLFLSYEGLRQRQAVPLSATTLTDAQRAQALATSDPIIQKLIPLIPVANSGTNQFASSAVAPVNIEQGTANFSHSFTDTNHLNVYYAIQPRRTERAALHRCQQFPGRWRPAQRQAPALDVDRYVGDQPNHGQRSSLGLQSDSHHLQPPKHVECSRFRNQQRRHSRHRLTADQRRRDGAGHGTVHLRRRQWISARARRQRRSPVGHAELDPWQAHTIKFGGEFRRQNSDSFSYTPGTFTFPTIAAFLADQATAFTANTSNRSSRAYGNSLGVFLTDSWKVSPRRLTLSLGIRYDWYGTPTEAQNRFVVFDPATDTLQVHVGQGSGPSLAYDQSAKNFQPRVGFAWDPFKNGKTVIRSAYALMTDQPTLGLVTALATNPPYAFPISFSPSPAVQFVTLANAFAAASGSVSPLSVAHGYQDAYVAQWNFNIQQDLGDGYGIMAGYFASKGTHLNIERNYNQPTNGVRPYPTLSASSPIDPSLPLSNILVYESVGNSSYNGLWLTLKKRLAHGLLLDGNYTFSKSIDDNSRNVQGLAIQDSYNVRGDRGLSDFDARHHFVLSAVYNLPFTGNRLKEGWQLSLIETLQSGNPLNVRLSNTSFAGAAVLRPNIAAPVITGYTPATNGSATTVTYIQNPSAFINQGTTPGTVLGFGNLGRNVIIGPGVSNLDFSMKKSTRLTERLTLRIEASAFDLLNQADRTNPVLTIGSATLGLITGGTRAPAGDFGSSRQIQLAMKLLF